MKLDGLASVFPLTSNALKESTPSARPEFEGLDHTRLLREDLLARIEARLAVAPSSVDLQTERAHLLAELERPKEAAQAYHVAVNAGQEKYPVSHRAYSIFPFQGKGLPLTVLLLVTPGWGNAPFRKYLDDQTFLTLQVVTDFHDPGLALPPHQLVINCVSDADSCPASLEVAAALLAKTDAPLINAPGDVLGTTRELNAQRLGSIAGVRTPRIATFSRTQLERDDVGAKLAAGGFSFPLLARSPGYHTGKHFIRAENAQELRAALPNLPGENITVLEYLDARDGDGLIRKYRVMMIGGKLYPAHLAAGRDWKVHFFSSTTPESAEQRAADQQFLENMTLCLGTRIIDTLGRIRDNLKLDYAGVDFSIDAHNNVLAFEANATMNINPPDADEMWAYRRAPVQLIADAVRTLFLDKAFSRIDPATSSPTRALQELTLRQLGSLLEFQPGRVDLQIEQVRLLIALERFNDAKNILMGILTKEPTHVVALYNLGILLTMLGYYQDAQKMYRAVVALDPGLVQGRLNLARLLREEGELKEARAQYEIILQAVPDHAEAHRDLACVLRYQHEDEAAREHLKIAARIKPMTPPVHVRGELPRIVVLTAPCGGNSPITRYLDKKAFQTHGLIPDSYDPAAPLPPHRLIVNAIADADHCGPSLEPIARILEQTTRPVVNAPARIGVTGRAENSRLLGALDGVVTPRIATLSNEILAGAGGPAALEQLGFTFPILLRSPGFHQGKHFVRVGTPDALPAAVASLPGRSQMAIEYLDARDEDGKIRKYRVMMIDGKLHPLHKAVSQKWMIHYFSAEMADSAAHRAEDEAFLADMPAVLGPRAIAALGRIRDALGLDYAGADFSIGRGGEILLFEANASMSVPLPQPGDQWEYRRGPAARIQDAVREMILSRAGLE
jgi:tetratricopeptide (TPR) repeat protein